MDEIIETTEVIKVNDKRISAQAETEIKTIDENNDQFLAMVERLSMRPDIPVEKIKQIMDMQEHILDRNAEQAFNAAMVRTQSKMKVIPRTSENKQTKSFYSKHEDIVRIAAPIYTAEGFSLSFYEGDTPKANHIRVMCDIMHEQGHTKTRFIDVAIDMAGIQGAVNKTLIHGEGSSFSYGKRYLTCLIFNIPTGDDDDGNKAGDNKTEYITEAQVKEIKKIIEDKNIDTVPFFKWAKVSKVEDITTKAYKEVMDTLKAAKGRPKTKKCPEFEGKKEVPETDCIKCKMKEGCPEWS